MHISALCPYKTAFLSSAEIEIQSLKDYFYACCHQQKTAGDLGTEQETHFLEHRMEHPSRGFPLMHYFAPGEAANYYCD